MLLGQDALAGSSEDEAGHDLPMAVEDRGGEAGRALSDLVHGDRQARAADLVQLPA